MTGLVVVGAGGLGREVAAYAVAAHGADAVRGFLDDDAACAADPRLTAPYLGPTSTVATSGASAVIAVGDPATRARLAERMRTGGWRLASVVHPMAVVSTTAVLGEGCVLAPFVYVGPHAAIGDNVIVNVHSSVGHDTTLGSSCVLSPHAAVSGHARLGERVFLGTAAIIGVHRSVGSDSKVAAGAVVHRDVAGRSLAAGNPATSRVMFAAFTRDEPEPSA